MNYTHNSILSLVSLLTVIGFCSAEERTFSLSGMVSEVPVELQGQFTVGDPINGSYTFETTAEDTMPGNPNVGAYIFSVSAFEMTIGTYDLVSTLIGGDIEVVNGLNGQDDSYRVVTFANGASVGTFDPFLMALQLVDSTGTAFSSDAIPVNPPMLSLFDNADITLDFSDQTTVRMSGVVETLVVPEPTMSCLARLSVLILLIKFHATKTA